MSCLVPLKEIHQMIVTFPSLLSDKLCIFLVQLKSNKFLMTRYSSKYSNKLKNADEYGVNCIPWLMFANNTNETATYMYNGLFRRNPFMKPSTCINQDYHKTLNTTKLYDTYELLLFTNTGMNNETSCKGSWALPW